MVPVLSRLAVKQCFCKAKRKAETVFLPLTQNANLWNCLLGLIPSPMKYIFLAAFEKWDSSRNNQPNLFLLVVAQCLESKTLGNAFILASYLWRHYGDNAYEVFLWLKVPHICKEIAAITWGLLQHISAKTSSQKSFIHPFVHLIH